MGFSPEQIIIGKEPPSAWREGFSTEKQARTRGWIDQCFSIIMAKARHCRYA
jgi:hypothetical protein